MRIKIRYTLVWFIYKFENKKLELTKKIFFFYKQTRAGKKIKQTSLLF